MNLDSSSPDKKSKKPTEDLSMDDFDFKPITSGLGFHQPKTTEIKPAFVERPTLNVVTPPMPSPIPVAPKKPEMNVYQNDLSMFYGQQNNVTPINAKVAAEQVKEEKTYRLASKPQRIIAYLIDVAVLLAFVGLVMSLMAKTVNMDLMEIWSSYPSEITPLVVTLFVGFYMIYFSVLEKASSSTLGKNLLGIRVVNQDNKTQAFSALFTRSLVTLLNFISLGLFSYFDLQNKMTHSKVIKVD